MVAVMAVMMLGLAMSSAGKRMWITTWSEMQMQPACACFSLRLGWLEALCWTVLVQCSAVQHVCVCVCVSCDVQDRQGKGAKKDLYGPRWMG